MHIFATSPTSFRHEWQDGCAGHPALDGAAQVVIGRLKAHRCGAVFEDAHAEIARLHGHAFRPRSIASSRAAVAGRTLGFEDVASLQIRTEIVDVRAGQGGGHVNQQQGEDSLHSLSTRL